MKLLALANPYSDTITLQGGEAKSYRSGKRQTNPYKNVASELDPCEK